MIFPIVASMKQKNGWPDRLVGHRWLKLVLLEFKGPKTAVRLDQKIVLRELRSRDLPAFVVREPMYVEDEEGNVLSTFDGTGKGLILTLKELIYGRGAEDVSDGSHRD